MNEETTFTTTTSLTELIENLAGSKPSDSLLTSKFSGWQANLISTDNTRLIYKYPCWLLDDKPLSKLGILNAINAGLFRSEWTEWETCG